MTETEFELFLDSLRVPGTLHISPKRVVAVLGIRAKQLAAISNPDGNVVIRNDHGTARMQAVLRDLVRILSAVRANHETPEQMLYWLMNYPIPQFYYRTAFEMYANARTEEVIAALSIFPARTASVALRYSSAI